MFRKMSNKILKLNDAEQCGIFRELKNEEKKTSNSGMYVDRSLSSAEAPNNERAGDDEKSEKAESAI